MDSKKVNTQKAIEIVKDYFVKLKGAHVEVGTRKLIDWLNFDVISAKEEKGEFVIDCEILGNLFSQQREKYKLTVNKEGEITEVIKENGHG